MTTSAHSVNMPDAPNSLPTSMPAWLKVEDKFYEFLAGGAKAAMFMLALDFGLPELLRRGPLSAEQIADRLLLEPMRARKWITLLTTLELLEENHGEYGPLYSNGPVLAAMAHPESSYFYREFVRYWRVAVYRDLGAILSGAPVEYMVRYPPQDTNDVALLHDWMRSGALLTLKVIERTFDFSHVGRMLDVAGGDATMACEIARKHPNPQITVFNIPKAAALGRANIQRQKVGHRVHVVEGNFLTDPLPLEDFELVMFSRVLADWSPEVTFSLLKKAFASLGAGGTLLIAEPFRDENPDLSIAWDHSYLPYDDFGDYAYKPTDLYRKLLKEAGFIETQHIPRTDTIHGVLISKKPK